MTLTPSERHSGLAIRLYRGRASDPAFESAAQDLRPWIGAQSPSLCPPDNITHADEVQEVEPHINPIIGSHDAQAATPVQAAK